MIASGLPGETTDHSSTSPPIDILAELELVRRRSELFERRLASWEAGLLEIRQRLHVLETRRDPESPAWLDALGDLRHRIDCLERRRRASEAPSLSSTPMTPEAPSLPPPILIKEGKC